MARNKPASAAVRVPRGENAPKAPRLVRGPQELHVAEIPGLRERKKVRLRQQIIETSIRLFRERGYENTRIDDIIALLEISQPG